MAAERRELDLGFGPGPLTGLGDGDLLIQVGFQRQGFAASNAGDTLAVITVAPAWPESVPDVAADSGLDDLVGTPGFNRPGGSASNTGDKLLTHDTAPQWPQSLEKLDLGFGRAPSPASGTATC